MKRKFTATWKIIHILSYTQKWNLIRAKSKTCKIHAIDVLLHVKILILGFVS